MRMMALVLVYLMVFCGIALAIDEADKAKVCFEEKCFRTEVMTNPDDRARGLMFRESLAEDEAMLFVFDRLDRHSFWMENMNFPIDILWMDEKKEVIYISANIPPCATEQCPLYTPIDNAKYVLEIPAGSAEANNILIGSTLTF